MYVYGYGSFLLRSPRYWYGFRSFLIRSPMSQMLCPNVWSFTGLVGHCVNQAVPWGFASKNTLGYLLESPVPVHVLTGTWSFLYISIEVALRHLTVPWGWAIFWVCGPRARHTPSSREAGCRSCSCSVARSAVGGVQGAAPCPRPGAPPRAPCRPSCRVRRLVEALVGNTLRGGPAHGDEHSTWTPMAGCPATRAERRPLLGPCPQPRGARGAQPFHSAAEAGTARGSGRK